ncbi:MarR family winged helix-turn-helix transcriptional regulator [Streptomyces sp. NPDC001351]|uniref:MarR family winged helix-turn-helix transcriptional regulator n=1 Tax=Streptomyces sp. NPDC001351 TaxID=3364564 RepID=UPI0036928893
MEAEPTWLSPEEMRLWRAWVDVSWRVEREVSEQIRRDAGITHNQYAILTALSQLPDRSARMSAISEGTHIPRTRLTHQIDRMECAGLIRRRPFAGDSRVVMVELTDQGADLLTRTAPGHARTVRSALLDALGPDEIRTLTGLLEANTAHSEPAAQRPDGAT